MNTTHYTLAQQNEMFPDGAVITISASTVKAANGTFVIDGRLMDQPDGDNYFFYKRLGVNGKPLKSTCTNNFRGDRFSDLVIYATVISKP